MVLPRAVGAGFEPGKQSSKEKVEVLTFNNENDARSFVQLALGAGYTSKLLETAVGVAESVGAKRLQMRWDDLKIHERVAPRPVPAGGAPPAGAPPAAKGADDAASRRPEMSVVGESVNNVKVPKVQRRQDVRVLSFTPGANMFLVSAVPHDDSEGEARLMLMNVADLGKLGLHVAEEGDPQPAGPPAPESVADTNLEEYFSAEALRALDGDLIDSLRSTPRSVALAKVAKRPHAISARDALEAFVQSDFPILGSPRLSGEGIQWRTEHVRSSALEVLYDAMLVNPVCEGADLAVELAQLQAAGMYALELSSAVLARAKEKKCGDGVGWKQLEPVKSAEPGERLAKTAEMIAEGLRWIEDWIIINAERRRQTGARRDAWHRRRSAQDAGASASADNQRPPTVRTYKDVIGNAHPFMQAAQGACGVDAAGFLEVVVPYLHGMGARGELGLSVDLANVDLNITLWNAEVGEWSGLRIPAVGAPTPEAVQSALGALRAALAACSSANEVVVALRSLAKRHTSSSAAGTSGLGQGQMPMLVDALSKRGNTGGSGAASASLSERRVSGACVQLIKLVASGAKSLPTGAWTNAMEVMNESGFANPPVGAWLESLGELDAKVPGLKRLVMCFDGLAFKAGKDAAGVAEASVAYDVGVLIDLTVETVRYAYHGRDQPESSTALRALDLMRTGQFRKLRLYDMLSDSDVRARVAKSGVTLAEGGGMFAGYENVDRKLLQAMIVDLLQKSVDVQALIKPTDSAALLRIKRVLGERLIAMLGVGVYLNRPGDRVMEATSFSCSDYLAMSLSRLSESEEKGRRGDMPAPTPLSEVDILDGGCEREVLRQQSMVIAAARSYGAGSMAAGGGGGEGGSGGGGGSGGPTPSFLIAAPLGLRHGFLFLAARARPPRAGGRPRSAPRQKFRWEKRTNILFIEG